MNEWVPLGQREGWQEPPKEPFEGVEPHMIGPLDEWVGDRLGVSLDGLGLDVFAVDSDRRLQRIAVKLRWPTEGGGNRVLTRARTSSENRLAFLDALLQFTDDPGDEYAGGAVQLAQILEDCGSAWTAAPHGRSLSRRVDRAAQAMAAEVLSAGDLASAELAEAWQATYGREPNPSDAWDHAIKAVEHVYVPVVVAGLAKNKQATLGHVIGQLGPTQNEHGWETTVSADPADPASGVRVIRGMLQALWGNPDRHGGSPAGRPPAQAEAEALVQLAVTLVQWGRQGVLRKKVKT